MIFVLEQRLAAQSVKREKSIKVLLDVSTALFAPSFVSELVRPQLIFSWETTRDVFGKVSHSSIMRLSEASFKKLYDIMTQTLKQQVVAACRVPRDIITITKNHMAAVRLVIDDGQSGANTIAQTEAAVDSNANSLTDGQLADLRHTLMNFLHGHHGKISVLLEDKLQRSTSVFVRDTSALPADLTPRCPVPLGTVTYYDRSGNVTRSETLASHPHLGLENKPITPSRLGENFFVAAKRNKEGAGGLAASSSNASASTTAASATSPQRSLAHIPKAAPVGRGAYASNSAAAVSTLTNFIVNNAPKDTVKIQSLFDDDTTSAGAAGGSSGGDVIQIKRMSREEVERANSELMSVMSGFSAKAPTPPPAGAGGDDLLDLLDTA
jgi:hypothetical protein